MGSVPSQVVGFLNYPDPSSHTVAASNRNEYQESS
jgi:hypothetical protein